MTLNALLASAESAFGAHLSARVIACTHTHTHTHTHSTDGSSGDERESFLLLSLCECIKPVMIIKAIRGPVLFRSFSAALHAVVNPDNVKASVQLYTCCSDVHMII